MIACGSNWFKHTTWIKITWYFKKPDLNLYCFFTNNYIALGTEMFSFLLSVCHTGDSKIEINTFTYQMSAPQHFVITCFWISNEHIVHANSVYVFPKDCCCHVLSYHFWNICLFWEIFRSCLSHKPGSLDRIQPLWNYLSLTIMQQSLPII